MVRPRTNDDLDRCALILEAVHRAEAAAAGARHAVLDVVETNTDAIRLYERRGWWRAFSEPWAAAAEGTR